MPPVLIYLIRSAVTRAAVKLNLKSGINHVHFMPNCIAAAFKCVGPLSEVQGWINSHASGNSLRNTQGIWKRWEKWYYRLWRSNTYDESRATYTNVHDRQIEMCCYMRNWSCISSANSTMFSLDFIKDDLWRLIAPSPAQRHPRSWRWIVWSGCWKCTSGARRTQSGSRLLRSPAFIIVHKWEADKSQSSRLFRKFQKDHQCKKLSSWVRASLSVVKALLLG